MSVETTKPVGRPRVAGKESTIRVGFSVNARRWLSFLKEAERLGVSYSEMFRIMVDEYFKSRQNP